ncbi:hypothetical protein Tco_1199765, partial [Tanacetum coccineum]
VNVQVSATEIPPSSITTFPPPPIPLIQHLQQTPVSTPIIVPIVSLILGIVDNYLASKLKDVVDVAIQLQSDRLREEAQAENQDFLNKIDESMKKVIKEQVQVQVKEQISKILLRIEKLVNEQLEAEVLIEGSKSKTRSTGKSAQAEEQVHTDKDLEEPAHQEFKTVGLTFELMKGSCKSLMELEYFLEEIYKATTDQLDWNNPDEHQYPHDVCKPLPLIPNSRGRRVIPFDNFINNDLAYLSGGVSSRTYTTSVTKTKATDYGHIKWIEDLVPNTMWSLVLIVYDKHAL